MYDFLKSLTSSLSAIERAPRLQEQICLSLKYQEYKETGPIKNETNNILSQNL